MENSNLPNVVIIGAGFFGSTVARILAENGFTVTIKEQRNHIAGNCFDYIDPDTNILIQKYGTHIFHTNNLHIWNFVNKFSKFIPYTHYVKAFSDNNFYTLPINLNTFNEVFSVNLDENNLQHFVDKIRTPIENPKNIEEYCIDKFGSRIYEKLIKGYTTKQWGKEPKFLPREIIERIPVRNNRNNSYFSDDIVALPERGFSALFANLLDHPNISVQLNTQFQIDEYFSNDKLIFVYSGALDKLFNYSEGALEWRNVNFEFETLKINTFQDLPVINYPELKYKFTRIHEFKHLYSSNLNKDLNRTVIAKEYSSEGNHAPSYPVRTIANMNLQNLYKAKVESMSNFYVGGRLGSYLYLDMHMAIGQGLKLSHEILSRFGLGSTNFNQEI